MLCGFALSGSVTADEPAFFSTPEAETQAQPLREVSPSFAASKLPTGTVDETVGDTRVAVNALPPLTIAAIWQSRKLLILTPLLALLPGAMLVLALLERNRRVRLLWRDLLNSMQTQREDLQRLADLSRHFELFLAHSVDFVYLKDAHGRYVFASDSVARSVGSNSRESLAGRRDEDIYPPDIAREYAQQEAELFQSAKPQLDLRRSYERSDGSIGWLSTHNWPVLSPEGGRVLGLFGISRDITAEHAYESQLERAANHDGLTGLPNRGLFFDRLQQAMAAAERRGSEIAIVYLDVDRFKQVNDSHGHAVGDAMLIRFSELLSSQLRRSDTVARLGGDEFALLLADLSSREEGLVLLDRLLVSVARPQSVAGVSLKMSASAGVVFYGGDAQSNPNILLSQADAAMYKAKEAGRDRYRVFEEQERGRLDSLSKSIARGMELHEFELHYQPIVDLRTGAVVGLEALLRWRQDNGELKLPGEFLPHLRDESQSVELSRWVLREVLQQRCAWLEQDMCVPIHVNVTASDLGQIEFLARLEADIREILGAQDAQLVLEVSENTALADIKTINHVIEVCQGLGVGFAISEFGTGYSSLSQARELATETVKIDPKFVQSTHTSPVALSLVSGILAIAKAFDRKVIAEGLETVEQGEMLLELGCHLAQGFAIAGPMPALDVQDWMIDWVPDTRWTEFRSSGVKNSASQALGLVR